MARILRDVGLAATELGPEGFLPSDPDELTALLDSYGLSCVGTFAPVVLHDAGVMPKRVCAGDAEKCHWSAIVDVTMNPCARPSAC